MITFINCFIGTCIGAMVATIIYLYYQLKHQASDINMVYSDEAATIIENLKKDRDYYKGNAEQFRELWIATANLYQQIDTTQKMIDNTKAEVEECLRNIPENAKP